MRRRLFNTMLMAAALALALLLIYQVNVISKRFFLHADLTRHQLLSISEKTRSIVQKRITRKLEVKVLLGSNPLLYELLQGLLEQYHAAAPAIEVEFLDPRRDRDAVVKLIQDYKLATGEGIVLRYGGRDKTIAIADLAELEADPISQQYRMQKPRIKSFKGEQALTAAIIELTEDRQQKVYFLQGHGEYGIEQFDEMKGLNKLVEQLRRDNLIVESLNLREKGAVPADCDLLVVAGPRDSIPRTEAAQLQAYLQTGGRAIVLLAPVSQKEPDRLRESGLEETLGEFGVQPTQSLMVEPVQDIFGRVFQDVRMVYATGFGTHPIVDGFRLEGAQAQFTRSRVLNARSVKDGEATAIVMSSAQGWGETRFDSQTPAQHDDRDLAGPVTIAIAATGPAEQGASVTPPPAEGPQAQAADEAAGKWRLVVCGNADFIANGFLYEAIHLDLFLGMVNWCMSRAELIGFAPRTPENIKFSIPPDAMTLTWTIVLWVLPLGLMVAGMVGLVLRSGLAALLQTLLLEGDQRPAGVMALLGVCAALGVFLKVSADWTTSTQRLEHEARLLDLRRDDITGLTLARGDQAILLEKNERGDWKVVRPIEVAADRGACEALCSRLETVEKKSVLEGLAGSESKRGEFGLLAPRLTLIFREGAHETRLGLGSETALEQDRQVYVQVGKGPDLYTADAAFYTDLNKTLDDLRSKKLLDFESFKVNRLRVQQPDGTLSLSRDLERNWQASEPLRCRIDRQKVDDALTALADAQAESFIDQPEDDEAIYGLAPAVTTVTLVSEEAQDRPLVLELGKPVPGQEGRLFARRPGEAVVLEVPMSLSDALRLDIHALRDRKLERVDSFAAERLEIVRGEEKLELEKRDGAWQLVQPVARKAHEPRVKAFLDGLGELKWLRVVAEAPQDLSALGLEPPRWIVRFGKRDQTPTELRFSEEIAGAVHAKRKNETPVFSLDPAGLKDWTVDPLSFLDTEILKAESWNVETLEIARGAERVQLKKKDGDWRFADTAPGDLPSINAFLDQLASLKVSAWTHRAPYDEGSLGFQPPLCAVTLGLRSLGAEPAKAQVLEIGAAIGDEGHHARLKGGELVGTLSKALVEQLQKFTGKPPEKPPDTK